MEIPGFRVGENGLAGPEIPLWVTSTYSHSSVNDRWRQILRSAAEFPLGAITGNCRAAKAFASFAMKRSSVFWRSAPSLTNHSVFIGTRKAAKWRPCLANMEVPRPSVGSVVDMVAMATMMESMRYIGPLHIANGASRDRPDGSADKGAGPCAHKPIIEPLPS